MFFAIFITASVAVLLIVILIGARANYRDRLCKSFEALARRHHGIYQLTEPWRPVVEFRRQDVRVIIWADVWGRLWKRGRVQIRFEGGMPQDIQLLMRPRWVFGDAFRFNTVRSDSWLFNRTFLTRGQPADSLQQLLSRGVRARLDLLRQHAETRRFRVEVRHGGFEVIREGLFASREPLRKFLESTLNLYDEMTSVLAVGIDFVAQPTPALDQAVCKICGENLAEDIVFCRRCETPHHRDCWRFNGACAVYACGETRFRNDLP